MAKKIKIRASLKNDVTTVKAIMTHPMETGSRKDKASGELIPAHYIQTVVVSLNGEQVFNADWGTGVSKTPTFQLRSKEALLVIVSR